MFNLNNIYQFHRYKLNIFIKFICDLEHSYQIKYNAYPSITFVTVNT